MNLNVVLSFYPSHQFLNIIFYAFLIFLFNKLYKLITDFCSNLEGNVLISVQAMKMQLIQFNFRAESDTHSEIYLSLSESEAFRVRISFISMKKIIELRNGNPSKSPVTFCRWINIENRLNLFVNKKKSKMKIYSGLQRKKCEFFSINDGLK